MELHEAADFYEDRQKDLGMEFVKEIYSTIQRIIAFPEAWSRLSLNTRRCIAKRFPYGVIYQITKNEILIIAIMQLNRKPDYWKTRIT